MGRTPRLTSHCPSPSPPPPSTSPITRPRWSRWWRWRPSRPGPASTTPTLGSACRRLRLNGGSSCLSALLATMWSQAKRTTCSSGSWTTTRLPTSTSPTRRRGHHKLPHRGGEGGGDKGQQEKSGQDGGVDGGGEVQEDEGAEQQGQPGLQGEEEEEAGRGGAGVDHLAR